jgi:hypothetical protein
MAIDDRKSILLVCLIKSKVSKAIPVTGREGP